MITSRAAGYQKRYRQNHPDQRNRNRKRNYAQTQGGPNTRKHWTGAEDERVLAHSVPDRQLSAELGRSVMAIQVRRTRLKSEVSS